MSRYWNLDRVMRFVLWSLGIVASLCLVYYLRGVLFPFFAAFLIAYIVDPIVNKLQKKVKKRVIAVIIVLLAFCLILFGVGKIFIPQIVREVQTLGTLIARMFTDSEWSSRLNEFLPANLWETIKSMVSWDKLAAAMQHMDRRCCLARGACFLIRVRWPCGSRVRLLSLCTSCLSCSTCTRFVLAY